MSEVPAEKKASDPLIVGRYAIFEELAAGGMATVHLGRLLGSGGSGRTVAVKRLHKEYTKDPEFCAMFMDEARLVTRIKHPNCVRTVDVVQDEHGLFLVMEYVHGESLSRLMRSAREKKEQIPPKLLATLLHGVLLGLHAAHDATGPDGKPLNVVHRDVSPQNVIVGVDGIAKVLDFGIAKATGRMQTTREGQIKGKLAYMAPEQIRGQVDRRTDVFAAAVVLWEALANRRLHEGLKDVEIVTRVVQGKFVGPGTHAAGIPPELDQIVLKGLSPDPKKRYASALEMAGDLEKRVGLVTPAEIGAWVERHAKGVLAKRAAKVTACEESARGLRPSEAAMRVPALSTPDAFTPLSVLEPAAKSEVDIAGELDAGSSAAAVAAGRATPNAPALSPPAQPALAVANPSESGHTQITPSGTEIPLPHAAPPPTALHQRPAAIALLACSLVLALTGAALGGYALATRSAPAPPPAPQVAPPPPLPRPPPAEVADPETEPAQAPVLQRPRATSTGAASAAAPSATAPTTVADAGLGVIDTSGADAGKVSPLDFEEATPTPAPIPTPTPTPTQHLGGSHAHPVAPRPSTKPASSATKGCEPPYVIDANGNKQFKPECMGF